MQLHCPKKLKLGRRLLSICKRYFLITLSLSSFTKRNEDFLMLKLKALIKNELN
ncbi:hypothetical protein UT300012_12630 [Paraclostridium bifermentans]|nr:hypothetical protein PAGU1678_01880 [Paraclostridium bifermentans subsp. muricolitidis]